MIGGEKVLVEQDVDHPEHLERVAVVIDDVSELLEMPEACAKAPCRARYAHHEKDDDADAHLAKDEQGDEGQHRDDHNHDRLDGDRALLGHEDGYRLASGEINEGAVRGISEGGRFLVDGRGVGDCLRLRLGLLILSGLQRAGRVGISRIREVDAVLLVLYGLFGVLGHSCLLGVAVVLL